MDQRGESSNLTNTNKFVPSALARAPIGIITFSSDWRVEYINEVFYNYVSIYQLNFNPSLSPNIFEEKIFAEVNIKKDLLALKEGIPFEKIVKYSKTTEGGLICLIVKVSPVFEGSNFSGGILLLEDLRIPPVLLKERNLRTEQLEKILHNSNDLLLITDGQGIIKFSFGKLINLRKISPAELTGTSIDKIFAGSTGNAIKEMITSAADKKEKIKTFFDLKVNDEEMTYDCTVEPLFNWREQLQFITVNLKEMSSLIREQKFLRAEINELKQYQLISEAVTDAVFAVTSKGNIFFWNKAAEALFGYSRSEVYGKFFGKALDVFDKEYFDVIKDELAKDNIWKVTLTVYKKNGQKEIIDTKFSYGGNDPEIIIVLCSNITDRANKEQLLKASEEKFKDIVNKAAELICNLNLDGIITYANPALFKILKYTEDEIIDKKLAGFISHEYLKTNEFNLKKFDKIGLNEIQLPLITKSGEEITVKAIFSPVYEKNKLSFFNGIFTDITRKSQAIKDLNVLRSMFNAFQDGVAVVYEGKIILSNKIFPRIFGFDTESELNGKEITELIQEKDHAKIRSYIDSKGHKNDIPVRFEFLGNRKDGINFFAEMSISFFSTEDKNYSVIAVSDITERKRTQQAIKQSEEKYRNLTENIDDFLFSFERIGEKLLPVFYTASVEKITGFNQTDFLSDARLILKIIYPDDFSTVKKKFGSLIKNRTQTSGEFEFRIINKYGNLAWVRSKINLAREQSGKIIKIYGLVSDISLRRKAEEDLTKSTENLIKLNETKDRFISIISHDLRTPFSSILGFTDLLLSDKELNEYEKKQYIEFIQESSRSMLSLVNSLLDWTRLQTGRIRFEPERTEVNKIIENSLNSMSGAALQKKIKISSKVDSGIYIFSDKDLILQVFNNLISNAIKFTSTGGLINISVHPSQKVRFLEFSVKDNGTGIKAENINKLFRIDTKFSSDGTAGEKGTGLGLSLVHEIIEKHGGSIWVESEFGKGSDFKFTLPIASANILLVDDSKTDRLLYSKILKNMTPDYQIDLASDGIEALKRITEAPPALVITDHIMPKMNGYQLVSELSKAIMKSKPPVIVLSSDIDRNEIEAYHSLGVDFVFQKPVNLSSFKQAVEKTLRKGMLGN